MKLRRVIVQFEVETDAKADWLKKSTIFVGHSCRVVYVEATRVNVVRQSTTARKSRKEKAK